MKSFKEHVNVIKIGKGGNTSRKSEDFMDELHDTTDEHPFNGHERLYKGKATVHASRDGPNEVHLHDIRSFEPGAGSELVDHLKSLADKHGVTISGTAKAYSKTSKYPMNSKQLSGWYKKRGFNVARGNADDGYGISYEPKKSD
jgi:hypothetical protein